MDSTKKKLWERYPIRKKAVLAAIVIVIANAMTGLGIASAGFLIVANALIAIFTLLGMVSSAEAETTPLVDPQAADGVPLIRADIAPELVEWDQALQRQAFVQSQHPANGSFSGFPENVSWDPEESQPTKLTPVTDIGAAKKRQPAKKRATPKKAVAKKKAAPKKNPN